MVRHAEREGNLDQLSAQGEKRAEAIAGLGQTLKVAAIYSTNTLRTKSTALPLAKALKLQTQLYGRISEEWLNEITATYAGQVVLIVGHSNTTGVIAAKLAGEKDSFAIGHDEYDTLFVITKSEATAHCVRLKYGRDSTDAPAADADKMAPAVHSPEQ